MKKFIALTMAVLMMVGLVACGSADSGSSNPGAAYNIGVCQLVQHVALDAATQGFVDALNAELGAENINWNIRTQQAIPTPATPSSTASFPLTLT